MPFKPLSHPLILAEVENRSLYNLLECEEEFRTKLLGFFLTSTGDKEKLASMTKQVSDSIATVKRFKKELGMIVIKFSARVANVHTLVDGTLAESDREMLRRRDDSFRGIL